jgi:mannose-6-phosphate isomerase-like protein (cupin superfamily)
MSASHGAEPDLWFLNTRTAVLRASASAPDGVSLVEQWLPFGDSAPLHVHHREDEIFHILDGVMRFRAGETETVARAGDTVVGPKGVPHTFRVESPQGAHCMVMVTRGDFEGMAREVGRPAQAPGLPDPVEPTPAMIEALVAAAERNHITILGAPMGPA